MAELWIVVVPNLAEKTVEVAGLSGTREDSLAYAQEHFAGQTFEVFSITDNRQFRARLTCWFAELDVVGVENSQAVLTTLTSTAALVMKCINAAQKVMKEVENVGTEDNLRSVRT